MFSFEMTVLESVGWIEHVEIRRVGQVEIKQLELEEDLEKL